MRNTLFLFIATAAFLGSAEGAAAALQEQPATESPAPLPPDEAAMWALLLPSKDAGTPDPSAIAVQLTRDGRTSVRPLVAILMGESAEPEPGHDVHPRAIELRQQILAEALRRLPPNDVIDTLRSRITDKTDVAVRMLVIRALADIGGWRAFDGVMGIAMSLDPIQFQRKYVQVSIEESLVKLAAKNPRLVRRLEQMLVDSPTDFAPLLARTLTAARIPTALRALPTCMGRDAALDLCALQELAKIGARFDPDLDPEATKRMRLLLDSPDGDVQRAAATVLARIGDAQSFPAIVAKLSSADPLTVGAARWSLETMSGVKLGNNTDAWTAWYAEQQEWLEETLPMLSEDLVSPDPTHVKSAATQLLQRKFHRHEVAAALQPMLALEDPAAQRLACEALAHMGSPRAVPWLLEKLDSPHTEIRHAAWTGLRELTKTDLPLDVLAWRVALAP
jgi:HEAT repeat protein